MPQLEKITTKYLYLCNRNGGGGGEEEEGEEVEGGEGEGAARSTIGRQHI